MRLRFLRVLGWLAGALTALLLAAPAASAETESADAGGDMILGWVLLIGGGLAAIGAFAYMYVKKRDLPPPLDQGMPRPKGGR